MKTTEGTHIGRKIERIRMIKGIKQDALAHDLGISQGAVSKLEQSETIDDDKLAQVAKALGVTKEAIQNFNEDALVNIINSTFHDQASVSANYFPTFNPIDKLVEVYAEKEKLFERLLEAERSKTAMLETLLQKK